MSEVNENSSINDLLDLLSDNREWAAETVRERVKQKNTAISQQAETIIELMQQLAALREDNQRLVARIAEERSKTLEQIRNKHIAELEAHLAALREAIELCERTRKYNGSGGTCKAHIDSMEALLGEQR